MTPYLMTYDLWESWLQDLRNLAEVKIQDATFHQASRSNTMNSTISLPVSQAMESARTSEQ
ncbi:hypothetical protein N1851_017181 [Merluccius polli]|uniref:Uncharacterized protein n=1 Tax=Merluccius polli TaxID=89951 RepID=A0AA47MQ20_MERPO|nr:hypothetical protein N1851_017181 [Merluccius polli]